MAVAARADQAAKLRLIAGKRSGHAGALHGHRPERIIAIGSGKGGVGKSNIALNVAIELSRRSRRVCLFDADLGMANAHILAGVTPRRTLAHCFRGDCDLSEVVTNGPRGIGLICGSNGMIEIADLPAARRAKLCDAMMNLRYDFEFLLIDAGAGIASNVLAFMENADQAIIVVTPEPTSMADAYGMIKALNRRAYAGRVSIVVNRAASVGEARMISEKMISLSMQFLNQAVDGVGFLLEDPVVVRAVRTQKPFVDVDASSRASRSIARIVDRLEEAPESDEYRPAASEISDPQGSETRQGRISKWLTRLFQ